jgi:hypothetical protein
MAVGARHDLLTFDVQTNSPATNKLAAGRETSQPLPSHQRVAAVSLDEYCEKLGVMQVDILKVDVEGMEPWVIEGSARLLREKRIKAMLIEICPANLAAVGASVTSLYQVIVGAGYQTYRLSANGTPEKILTVGDLDQIVLENIAVLPN